MSIATCIGCGCDDYHACANDKTGQPCSWLRVDYDAGFGVCSECPDHVVRWDAGDRHVVIPMGLAIWTVYDNPADYPGLFVARLFNGDHASQTVVTANSLEEIHALLPQDMYRIPRQEADDPVIVEIWL